MKTLTIFAAVGSVLTIIVACETSTLSSPDADVSLHYAVHESGRCYAVRGVIRAQVIPGGAIGTIHGDLEGTITTTQQPDPVGSTDEFVTGRAVHLIGFQTVEVTGGNVPVLVGRTIGWSIETRAIHLPPIRRASSTITIVEGATGNLVSHGILDLVTLTTTFDYEGSICP